jgi:hypothetical protein
MLASRCAKPALARKRSEQNDQRCGQPGQQHGRRIPSLSSEHTLSTCCRLVSSFFTETVQQIHSLRASGVMSSHAASAFASDASAFRRSAGRSCTTPPEIRTVAIGISRQVTTEWYLKEVMGRMHCPAETIRHVVPLWQTATVPYQSGLRSLRLAYDCQKDESRSAKAWSAFDSSEFCNPD